MTRHPCSHSFGLDPSPEAQASRSAGSACRTPLAGLLRLALGSSGPDWGPDSAQTGRFPPHKAEGKSSPGGVGRVCGQRRKRRKRLGSRGWGEPAFTAEEGEVGR